jgi:hypothetical protein
MLLASSGLAHAAVSRDFFGVVPQGQLSSRDFARMQGVVGTLRVPALWFQLEPSPGKYDFASLDQAVGEAADHGIRVLPFVYGTPSWLTGDPALPPQATARGRSAWAAFLRRLVDRYGPGGDFWKGRARSEPIRSWQIWNEPNFSLFWRPRPSPSGYAQLLGLAARAIRGDDHGARIVSAGLAPVERGPLPWSYLRRLYRVPGVKRSFDVVGLHPYASSMRSLEYQIAQARRAMAMAGDRATPLELTEFGIASAGFAGSPMVKTLTGQAAFLRRAYQLLLQGRSRWHLIGADWFASRDSLAVDPHCVFCQYAGLFDSDDKAKPAWAALKKISARATKVPVR